MITSWACEGQQVEPDCLCAVSASNREPPSDGTAAACSSDAVWPDAPPQGV